MGGFAGLLDSAMNAVGQTGVSLKSKRDYEQESARFDTEQSQAAARLAQSGADLTHANQENATRADELTELERKRAGEAEDRGIIMNYIQSVSPPPGWKPSAPAAQIPGANVRGVPVAGTPLRQSSIGIPMPLPGSVASPAQKPVYQTVMGPLQPGYSPDSWQWRDPLTVDR